MNGELRRRWCEALRSGTYPRGKFVLKSSQGQYCALGVLYDLAGLKWVEPKDDRCCYDTENVYWYVHLGLTTADFRVIGSMNDNDTSTEEIAEWIEQSIPVDGGSPSSFS